MKSKIDKIVIDIARSELKTAIVAVTTSLIVTGLMSYGIYLYLMDQVNKVK